jgi:hypothetical protein
MLLFKSVKIKIQSYNLACCFNGCKTWPLTLTDELD